MSTVGVTLCLAVVVVSILFTGFNGFYITILSCKQRVVTLDVVAIGIVFTWLYILVFYYLKFWICIRPRAIQCVFQIGSDLCVVI